MSLGRIRPTRPQKATDAARYSNDLIRDQRTLALRAKHPVWVLEDCEAVLVRKLLQQESKRGYIQGSLSSRDPTGLGRSAFNTEGLRL